METIVPVILGSIAAFAIIMYVILDGMDLGIGILFPWIPSKHHRDIMMSTIAPVWDGNETWLVLGAATLYGGFPVVYSTLLPTLYMPIMMMLVALIFRGVAFEFRFKAHDRSRPLWDFAFSAGSLMATFCQGIMLGTFVQGYETHTLANYGAYVWFTPFAILTGIALVFGYLLLGSTWLVGKTAGDLQKTVYHVAKVALVLVGCAMVVVSLFTPFVDAGVTARWFSFPNLLILAPLPLSTLGIGIYLWRCLQHQQEKPPFFLSIALFLLGFLGLAISVWPYLIPHVTTLWEAAGPLKSQITILIGLAILLPVLVGYTLYSYRVFRGKVTSADIHHY